MLRSSTVRIVVGLVAVLAALTLLRFKPWQDAPANRTREGQIAVGFLPVT